MKRTASDRTARQPKPVQQVEVTEKHVKRRVILFVIAVAVAVGAFVYAMSTLLRVETGWQAITVTASDMHCGQNFEFIYYVGDSETSTRAEFRALTALYSQACIDAYRIFNSAERFDGVGNLCTVNRSLNAPVQVEPALYKALETLERMGSRYLYLAPLGADYDSIFFCDADWETAAFDPYQNEDQRQYMAEVAAYANDPEAIQLQLLGNNTVQLHVSDEYQAFAREYAVTEYVGFYWMRDAFIIDYLAQTLEAAGFTKGALSSYDGFVRCLSDGQASYSYNYFDQTAMGSVFQAARLSYAGGTRLVYLRAFALNAAQKEYCYQFEDGSVRTAYIDTADGLSKAAMPALAATSTEKDCAEVLLSILPIYAADTLDTAALEALPSTGVYPLYCQENRIISTSPDVALPQIAEGYTVVGPDSGS